MSQLYVPEGTWVLCSEGKKIPKIQVASQSTIRIADGKLAATKDDRFDGNFVCLKMSAASAIVGALAAAAIAATGGAVLGGALAAGVAGVATGAGVGGMLSKVPSVCSLLCKPSVWTQIHPKVKFENKPALLQNATLSCMLGGLITLKMPNLQEAIDMGLIAGEDVYQDKEKDLEGLNEKGKPKSNATQEQIDSIAKYDRVSDKDIIKMGLDPSDFNDNNKSGFYSQLYKTDEDKYVLAFRGTEGKYNDIKEDVVQGIGISSAQSDKAADLSRMVDEALKGKELTITGHSLGGQLAAVAGGATGRPTYTYNAAGAHNATLRRNDVNRSDMNHIQAYNATDDPLNMSQDKREKILGKLGWLGGLAYITGGLPKAAGQRMEVETDVGIIKGHTAIHIVNELEKELEAMGGGNTTVKEKDI